MTALLAVTGQGNIFKELPHSLEVVDSSSVEPPAPKDVSKVLISPFQAVIVVALLV